MLFPKLVPAGTSYVRIPSTKRAAMRIVLETVQRGSRYWTAGTVTPEKALAFSERMAELYHADATQAQRAYSKSKGRANTALVMYHEPHEREIRFWLLVTPGEGLAHERERLLDAHAAREHLTWGTQYELVHVQRPRTHGGGRTWTWRLTDERYAMLEAATRARAAAHGGVGDRTDDLRSLVSAVMRMPGFYGIRQQQLSLLALGRGLWERTHRAGSTFDWPTVVPYLDKSFSCYHRPEPLRLDVLVRALGASSSAPAA